MMAATDMRMQAQIEPVKADPIKVKLLLVDDNPENLVALEATLEGLGQDLVKATSGIEALRYLLDDDFAAILLDVRMPEMDGFETATMIRSRKRSRNTPILFLTGYKNEEHLFRGYDLGAVDFLFKPIVPEILQSKVAVFVELSRNAILLKKQADDLQAAEASMRAVLEAAPEPMIIYDANERIQRVNPEAEKLFGYSRTELIGQSMAALSPEWKSVRPSMANEIICATKAAHTFPAEVRLKPVESAESGLVVSVIRDITERRIAQENARRITLELERQVADRTRELMIDIAERKRAEQALRESERSLRIAIEAAALGLWRINIEEDAIQVSPLTCEMFSFPKGSREVALADWKDRIHHEDRPAVEQALNGCLSDIHDFECEYRITQADGSFKWIFAKGQPLPPEEGPAVLVVGVFQDITHRKLAEEAERHRQKLESLGVLAGGIAHDFNNLLTGILGNASLLLEYAGEESFEKHSLNDLVKAAERAAELTRQMLAYSGRGKFVTHHIVIGNEAKEIANLVRASIPKQVRLEFDLDPKEPAVDGDRSQIQQLVMNLIINAAEAIGPEGGLVRISTRSEWLENSTSGFYPAEELPAGHYVMVEVRDTGHGMSEATRTRIFDPFFTTKFTGRGLGLAAALGIVRGHKGGISVDSAPGAGTTFRIYLPAGASTAGPEEVRVPRPSTKHGQGTVLVVDDESIVRSVAKSCLEHFGYKVLLAEDGNHALRVFQANPDAVSLVLLDMQMPGMDGVETLGKLREIRPNLTVVASSGFSESEALEKFGKGIAGFLQKPYPAKELAAKIQSVLQPDAVNGNTEKSGRAQ